MCRTSSWKYNRLSKELAMPGERVQLHSLGREIGIATKTSLQYGTSLDISFPTILHIFFNVRIKHATLKKFNSFQMIQWQGEMIDQVIDPLSQCIHWNTRRWIHSQLNILCSYSYKISMNHEIVGSSHLSMHFTVKLKEIIAF